MRERHLEEPEVLATGEDEQPEDEVCNTGQMFAIYFSRK